MAKIAHAKKSTEKGFSAIGSRGDWSALYNWVTLIARILAPMTLPPTAFSERRQPS